MLDTEDWLAAEKDGLEHDAQGITELADRDVLGDDVDGLNDLRLVIVRFDPVPGVLADPVGVNADLHGEIE